MLRAWLLIVSVFLAGYPSGARAGDATSVEAAVDSLLAPLIARDAASGTVLIARGGEILVAKGYGLANREHGVPNSAGTVYSLASITKSFTAIAIMQLWEQGLLGLDDPLSKYVPDYPHGDRITIHHLLTHTSGIRSYVFLPDFAEKERLPLGNREAIDWFKNEPLEFAPGERFSYSNSGYALLTYVIEVVSRRSYGDYLESNIFSPAGMTASAVDEYTSVVPHRATGYSRDSCTGGVTRATFREPGLAPGVGSITSTVLDLYRLDRAMREGRVLKPETQAVMFAPRVDTPWGDRYAYGWWIGASHGRRVAHHEGTTYGFATSFQRFLDDDVLVVVLLNQDLIVVNELYARLDAIAVGGPWEPLLDEPSSKAIEAFRSRAGAYRMEPQGEVLVSVDSVRLYVQETDCGRFEAWPMGGTRAFAPGLNALFTFSEDQEAGRTRIRAQYGVLRWDGERITPER